MKVISHLNNLAALKPTNNLQLQAVPHAVDVNIVTVQRAADPATLLEIQVLRKFNLITIEVPTQIGHDINR